MYLESQLPTHREDPDLIMESTSGTGTGTGNDSDSQGERGKDWGPCLVYLLVLVEGDPDVDLVHGLPEEERPEGHREVGRHPHHLPLLRSHSLSGSPRRIGGFWDDGCSVEMQEGIYNGRPADALLG